MSPDALGTLVIMDLLKFMGRPANSSQDGKRDFEVKVSLSEAEFDDVACMARAMGLPSKSEFFRQLLHIQAYGLLGVRALTIVDEK